MPFWPTRGGMTHEQAESWFRTYAEAFDAFDASAIADHLHVPCMILGRDYVVALQDRSEMIDTFEAANEAHRNLGYDHAVLDRCLAIPTGNPILLEARVDWTFVRADGSTMDRFGMVYFLKKLNETWRIAIAINVGEAT